MSPIYENTEELQRVVLIAVNTGGYDVETSMRELNELAKTAGAIVVAQIVQNSSAINNATYIGTGKIQEVKEFCQNNDVDLLIFDDELSGSQIRNIEEGTGVDVIDRTMLILDIFAMRALSKEGKLQVELAQQRYLLPRLYGMGAQLSRQGGGIGTRGPGETRLESDKRHIRRRVEALEAELDDVEKRRGHQRRRRRKSEVTTIAIVGYTNVGKSTLLNLLTDAGVLAENKLFATLDPTARELRLKDGQTAVLIDTVGLIQRLPHQLVKAFRSTLEEAATADIILNICDISDDNVHIQQQVTSELLDSLGCGDIPVIQVYNKIDMVENNSFTPMNNRAVFISAKDNIGINSLLDRIAEVLADKLVTLQLTIPYDKGQLLDTLRTQGNLISEEYTPEGISIKGTIGRRFKHLFELD